jgi:hypothetical protein
MRRIECGQRGSRCPVIGVDDKRRGEGEVPC